ncbi:protein aubergine-like isoform X1 [Wyeomyia smithii]|uniref:protein aubergine-like isoform X1 n=2 Tax=Wyeomyia smithii TaxID=174621 RepID=UPI0024681CB7|nr:protein aubergine-like isoform X1 [Wyeomyia smithii]
MAMRQGRYYSRMADGSSPQDGNGGRSRARGFTGSSRGGYNGGSSRGNNRHSSGAGWPGSEEHAPRGQVGSFQHRDSLPGSSRSSRPYSPPPRADESKIRPVDEMAALVHKTESSGGQRGRGAGAAGRGGMRGKRFLPEICRTRTDTTVSKQGSSGRQVMLQTNYFRIVRNEDERIFQYRVDFTPHVESNKQMKSLMFNLKSNIGGYLFDGTMLFTRNKLCTEEITYTTKDSTTEEEYVVKLRRTGVVDGTNETAFVIFNLINRKAMAGLKLQLIGRSYFDAEAKVSVRQYGIELYPGYVTSIRQHEKDVLMCAELTHRVMRTDTCYSLFEQCMNQRGNFRDNYKRMVLGSVVMTTYGNNKTYTISDVDFNVTPESSFETKNGSLTFMKYFKDRYNVNIRDPRQPMLVSRPKSRDIRAGLPELIYLVPELSRITGITDDMRKDFHLMRALADHTRLTPDKRIERLEVFNRRLQQCKDSSEIFTFWKTELDRRLVEVPARVLPPETVFFHPEQANYQMLAGDMAEWQMAFRNNPMYLTVALTNWVVVVPGGSERLIADFLQCLKQAAHGMHFQVEDPRRVVIPNDSPVVYVEQLSQICQRDPQLIMCLVTNDKVDRYAAIKKKCCVERAVPTQVMKTRTITPKGGNVRTLMSVATKVAIQMNCKLGGIPWVLKSPLSSVMVLGFDICKDSKDRSKAYGALVASMYGGGIKHPKYFSTVNQHSNGGELSSFLAINVIKAIRAYQGSFGGALPQRIVIYRDGVGDGQLNYVLEHEVAAVKEKLDAAYKTTEMPSRLTFFVVNKRINTRLFENRRNPPPGTVVDDVITLPERTDFYLVSQSVRQGTVSPTSYNILRDESGLNADRLQQYTFKQTHLYYNWSGTVGVPAVCQYAHKLSALAGQFLHQTPSTWLEKKLYYL